MGEKTLDDLFLDTLKNIYYAEKRIVKTAEEGKGRVLGQVPRVFVCWRAVG